MTDALIGKGTLLKRGDGATPTEAFTTVGEIISISGPEQSLDTVDATNMDSASSTREYIAGLIDSGEVSFEMNFLPATATQTNVRDDLTNRTLRNFQIIWPDTGNTQVDFAAFVTSVSRSTPLDDRMTASITLKISGVLTWS